MTESSLNRHPNRLVDRGLSRIWSLDDALFESLDARAAKRFVDHELDIRLAQSRFSPVPLALAVGLVWMHEDNPLPGWLGIVWVALVLCTQTFRRWRLQQLAISPAPPVKRFRAAQSLGLISGSSILVGLFSLPWMPAVPRAILTMVVTFMLIATVGNSLSSRFTIMFIVAPMISMLALAWALWPPPGVSHITGAMIAVLIVMLGLALGRLSRQATQSVLELLEARQDLERANGELNVLYDDAKAANRAKSQFLAAASHDLRQPIQALTAIAAAMRLNPRDPEHNSLVGTMNQALANLKDGLDDLLDLSRLEVGGMEFRREPIDLERLLNGKQAQFGPRARAEGLTLTISAERAVHAVTDRPALDRVLNNLIDNAIKYTPAGGRIELRASRQQSDVIVSVIDDGQGIAHEDQAHVFDAFYRVDEPARRRREGLGLGLAIVQRLCGLLQIPIELVSTPGKGTRIDLRFVATDQCERRNDAHAPQHTLRAGLQLLIVEDEEPVRMALAALLERLGASIELAATATEAMQCLARSDYDLIISDLRLGSAAAGVALIQHVRGHRPDTRLLVITGDTTLAAIGWLRDLGIPVLAKPVTAEALVNEINRIVSHDADGTDHRADVHQS
ncbi:MAG: hybrid sensor histidine kinase/response regulator [Burkholderiaceae bacterium]